MEQGKQIGNFEIIREIARGGMGIVYLAKQLPYHRKVALKVLRTDREGLSPDLIARFQREMKILAQLKHRHVVAVHFSGEYEEVPYYAMQLIKGPSLAKVIEGIGQGVYGNELSAFPSVSSEWFAHQAEEGSSPDLDSDTVVLNPGKMEKSPPESVVSRAAISIEKKLGYFLDIAARVAAVADALSYLHTEGVVHRDIKPANLLVGTEGFYIADFGLALRRGVLEDRKPFTVSGSPYYMSPEQCNPVGNVVDGRADIYSLGVTLYQLMTLVRPFRGHSIENTIHRVRHNAPKPPHEVNRRVPLALSSICLKAMEKDLEKRYQTAGEMAEDLFCFLASTSSEEG